MSLLWMEYENEFQNLVENAFQRSCTEDPAYYDGLPPRIRQIIYRDTRYNIDFLYTAYLLGDDKIMEDYAVWLYQLMASVLKQIPTATVAEYVIEHLDTIRRSIPDTVGAEKLPRLLHLLDLADDCVREAAKQPIPEIVHNARYEAEVEQYMDSLFQRNGRKTVQLIQEFSKKGIPLNDIYVDILAESMRRVGDLWHTARITVDTEHYCTSVTQMAMAQMYPLLFAHERKNKTLLCACPGTELHEMGARMVADLFENDGWDSIYLGAAVPEDAMLEAVATNQPDLIALSVTMPQHLIACRSLVDAIRKQYPDVKIAVGGKAFESTHDIWKQWPIDLYAPDARQLLEQANRIC